jgi:hypothetical protein
VAGELPRASQGRPLSLTAPAVRSMQCQRRQGALGDIIAAAVHDGGDDEAAQRSAWAECAAVLVVAIAVAVVQRSTNNPLPSPARLL